ncbi:MAG: OstA-like protein, partial [Candidatus Cryptobacteroides sp.]
MERKDKKITLLLGTLLGVSALLLASPQSDGDDPYVHLVKASSVRMITDENQKAYRQAVNATFLHNDTYLICDTAYWRVDENIINAFGNVRLTQDGTELTSQKLDYYVDDNLAQFRGGVVQLQDKENNILRTHFLDYNTADSVAVFSKGASMKDKDGQVIESIDGTYDSKAGLFTFSNNVNMFTDSVFIKTQSLDYHTETQKAVFKTYIDFWKDDNMLSAQKGWYDRERELFFFTGSVHATTKDNESWCDSLYYYRNLNNVLMRGTVQLQDSIRNTSAVSRYLFYEDSLATVTLMDEAAVSIVTQQEGQPADTLYFGADTLVYYTLKYCDISASEIKNAEERLADILTDPVGEYRRKASEAAEAAAQAAKEKAVGTRPELRPEGSAAPALAGEPRGSGESVKPAASGAEVAAPEAETAGIEPVAKGQKNGADKTQPDSLALGQLDSLTLSHPDSLALQDSFKVQADSILTASVDSTLTVSVDSTLMASADSTILASADSTLLAAVDSTELKVEVDTTKYGFAFARGNVKVFRKDIQVRCDSLRYCDLDSIARFYKNPVVWNEENRQYYSDSLFALIRNNAIDRASLLSNAFV